MDNRQMELEQKLCDCEMYINRDKLLRIFIGECDQTIGKRVKYYVRIVNVDPVTGKAREGKTVATRCDYKTALAIAKEHYFK